MLYRQLEPVAAENTFVGESIEARELAAFELVEKVIFVVAMVSWVEGVEVSVIGTFEALCKTCGFEVVSGKKVFEGKEVIKLGLMRTLMSSSGILSCGSFE